MSKLCPGDHICGQSVWVVQVQDTDRIVTQFNTEEEVQEAIFNKVHCKRYNLAEDAPMCQGELWGQFRYNTTLQSAQAVLTDPMYHH